MTTAQLHVEAPTDAQLAMIHRQCVHQRAGEMIVGDYNYPEAQ